MVLRARTSAVERGNVIPSVATLILLSRRLGDEVGAGALSSAARSRPRRRTPTGCAAATRSVIACSGAIWNCGRASRSTCSSVRAA
jgi:hypothetical protein